MSSILPLKPNLYDFLDNSFKYKLKLAFFLSNISINAYITSLHESMTFSGKVVLKAKYPYSTHRIQKIKNILLKY